MYVTFGLANVKIIWIDYESVNWTWYRSLESLNRFELIEINVLVKGDWPRLKRTRGFDVSYQKRSPIFVRRNWSANMQVPTGPIILPGNGNSDNIPV